jgi:SAM-dependent methyltransferase/RimJ/RimL family protein N-acetyltransferase
LTVNLRKLEVEDIDLLFEWRNYPEIIKRSTSQKKVGYKEHSDWFNNILVDENILSFVIEIDNIPSGHIRLEREDINCVITTYLLDKYTGKGYGVEAIKKACDMTLKQWKNISIIAFIRESNKSAQSAFSKAFFEYSFATSPPEQHVSMTFNEVKYEQQYTINNYSKLVNDYGDSYLSLNWGSKFGQVNRFKILSEIDSLNGKSVLDVGCGLGDFAGWLEGAGIDVQYTGVDITVDLVLKAKEKFPDYTFLVKSITDDSIFPDNSFDYVFASGIFATYKNNGDIQLRKSIENMWKISKSGIAFNTLSSWGGDNTNNEYRANPAIVLSFAKELSHWVVMRHDYHPADVTYYITKNKRT